MAVNLPGELPVADLTSDHLFDAEHQMGRHMIHWIRV